MRLDKAFTACSIEISTEKTKLMTNNTIGVNTEVKVSGQKLETVTNCKLLGSVITEDIAETTAGPNECDHCLSAPKEGRKIRLFKLPRHFPDTSSQAKSWLANGHIPTTAEKSIPETKILSAAMEYGRCWNALKNPGNSSLYSASPLRTERSGKVTWVTVGKLPHLKRHHAGLHADPHPFFPYFTARFSPCQKRTYHMASTPACGQSVACSTLGVYLYNEKVPRNSLLSR